MKLEGQMSLADETKEEVKIIYNLCYEANT